MILLCIDLSALLRLVKYGSRTVHFLSHWLTIVLCRIAQRTEWKISTYEYRIWAVLQHQLPMLSVWENIIMIIILGNPGKFSVVRSSLPEIYPWEPSNKKLVPEVRMMLYADWSTIFGRPITVEQRCSNVVKTSFGRHLGFEFSEQVIY